MTQHLDLTEYLILANILPALKVIRPGQTLTITSASLNLSFQSAPQAVTLPQLRTQLYIYLKANAIKPHFRVKINNEETILTIKRLNLIPIQVPKENIK